MDQHGKIARDLQNRIDKCSPNTTSEDDLSAHDATITAQICAGVQNRAKAKVPISEVDQFEQEVAMRRKKLLERADKQLLRNLMMEVTQLGLGIKQLRKVDNTNLEET